VDDLVVGPELTIPAAELAWRFSRSGGPGGQHVNTAATRAELRWNVAASAALGPVERERLLGALAGRLDADGTLRVVAEETRSQLENRERARERLAALVARALAPPRPRRATRPSAASREARLAVKRRRGEVKSERARRYGREPE
jgi:ribosome-associated protein